ncbi:complement C1q subcomponent subunit A-like isoform X1 [Antennarius striatus]|uniref:complement C1q subcomponent subunit A-like isoform X1 n=1 Tax=Antennarius striatus TaxID=241820 RepID=UPI0035B232E2
MEDDVMFTAVADHSWSCGPYEEDTTMIFNKVITNIGDGYDNTSGLFTAFTSGYYYFTLFYHAGTEHVSGLTLMKNSEVITNTFEDFENGPGFTDNAGKSAFVKLERGNVVFVRLPAHCQVHASDNTTTFSGFLVRKK